MRNKNMMSNCFFKSEVQFWDARDEKNIQKQNKNALYVSYSLGGEDI